MQCVSVDVHDVDNMIDDRERAAAAACGMAPGAAGQAPSLGAAEEVDTTSAAVALEQLLERCRPLLGAPPARVPCWQGTRRRTSAIQRRVTWVEDDESLSPRNPPSLQRPSKTDGDGQLLTRGRTPVRPTLEGVSFYKREIARESLAPLYALLRPVPRSETPQETGDETWDEADERPQRADGVLNETPQTVRSHSSATGTNRD